MHTRLWFSALLRSTNRCFLQRPPWPFGDAAGCGQSTAKTTLPSITILSWSMEEPKIGSAFNLSKCTKICTREIRKMKHRTKPRHKNIRRAFTAGTNTLILAENLRTFFFRICTSVMARPLWVTFSWNLSLNEVVISVFSTRNGPRTYSLSCNETAALIIDVLHHTEAKCAFVERLDRLQITCQDVARVFGYFLLFGQSTRRNLDRSSNFEVFFPERSPLRLEYRSSGKMLLVHWICLKDLSQVRTPGFQRHRASTGHSH